MHSVSLNKQATNDFERLPEQVGRRIDARLQTLAQNPRPHGYKKLQGQGNLYRIRIGDHRILYDIDDKERTVLVVSIAHRKDAYRDL